MDRVQVQRWRFWIRWTAALFVLLPLEVHYVFPIYTRVEASSEFGPIADLLFNFLFFSVALSTSYGFGLLMGAITNRLIRVKEKKHGNHS